MRRRGLTLVEVLMVGLVVSVLMAGLLQLFVSLHKANSFTTSMPPVQSDAVDVVNTVATALRRAPLNTVAANGTVNSAVHTADANAVTVFTTAGGDTAVFALNAGDFQRTQGGSTVTLVANQVDLALQYCVAPNNNYTVTSPIDDLAWGNDVQMSDLPRLIAVRVTATVTRDGLVGTYTSVVRLRNSPKKLSATS